MTRPLSFLAQALAYAAFAAAVGYLSSAPAYMPIALDEAMIKLSFSHVGQRKGECRTLSPEEIAKLPPNMRHSVDCPRERLPVLVDLVVDGETRFHRSLPPSGLWHDGASTVYQGFTVPAGRHQVQVRLRDTARPEGYDYERTADVELRPQQNLVIDFRSEVREFILR